MTFEYFGARFRLFNTSVSQAMFYIPSRWHGARDMRLLRKLVRPGDTIVDIGANVGSHSIPLAKMLGTTSRVYAFEPHPRTFAYLRANAALNRLPNLHLYNLALGDREGEIAFTDERSDDLNRVLLHGSGSITVPIKRLDSIEALADTAIHLLKIDVEGYELSVLRGASKALQRTEFIFLEANTRHSQEFGILYKILQAVCTRRTGRSTEFPTHKPWWSCPKRPMWTIGRTGSRRGMSPCCANGWRDKGFSCNR